jgi:hypothetical protein
METILYPDQYNLLWRFSWFALLSGCYATYTQHYNHAIACYAVLITSLNYWRYPANPSWSRFLDMTCVKLALTHHIITAYSMSNRIPYYILTATGLASYQLGVELYKREYWWASVYAHAMVHVIGNIGNIILYSSEPVSLSPLLIDKI